MKDNARRSLSLFLLGIVVGVGGVILFGKGESYSKNEDSEGVYFLIGEHCYDEAKEYMADLGNVEFTTKIEQLNFSLGEYPTAKYVAYISFGNMSLEELKAYARGATQDCSATASASFDFDNISDLKELSSLLSLLELNNSKPILLDIQGSKLVVRFRRNW
ncbi:hypothetical protein [Salinibius halmophilus]|uniref:hypothetical protein n=1 Tax=Salinibius halmophilus TaxID=1853216 RepID=UPI001314C580|nr:hypothetical protein [Salinibius halmophilus]